ncbi:MAG: hypothetical protein ACLUO4_07065 [Christensenellales bacterium]
MQKSWPEEETATSRPPPRCIRGKRFLVRFGARIGYGRCGEGVLFLVGLKKKRHRAGGKQRRKGKRLRWFNGRTLFPYYNGMVLEGRRENKSRGSGEEGWFLSKDMVK